MPLKKTRNPLEFHKASAPEPPGTSQGICTRDQNPPEPHHASSPRPSKTWVPAPETSGTSQGICTGTLRNPTRYLHRNPPEPGVEAAPDRTGANLG